MITTLWLTFFSLMTSLSNPDSDRPNIVLIIADDIGWNDFSCYGNRALKTPYCDRIAGSGMLFLNAFLTTSSCSPSRCSIITGRYPHSTGAAELHTPLPADQLPFPLLLKEAGYYCVQAGKTHMGPHVERAFDQMYGLDGAGDSGCERWVEALVDRPRDRPFFAWLAALDAHRAWQTEGLDFDVHMDQMMVPVQLADDEATRMDLRQYYLEIMRFDQYVGAVVAELSRQGVLDNTLLIVMSDNGMPFPGAKTRLYDRGIKTPLLIQWPRRIVPAQTCNALVSSIDLAPLCLEVAGISVPASFQGRSFRSLFDYPSGLFRREVFAEHNWHDYEAHERMVRNSDYLYIRNFRPNLPNGGPADSKRSDSQASLDARFRAGLLSPAQADHYLVPRPAEELYHVPTDPDHLYNLASDERFLPALLHMRHLLIDFVDQTADHVPEHLTPDAFDRSTGALLPGVERFDRVLRGEMPGLRPQALTVESCPGF